MYDLKLTNGLVVDPLNGICSAKDIAIEEGKIAAVSEEISGNAKKVIDVEGKTLIPGIIDMHTHMRTILGHPHAQRMIALAGVCTTLDMAGPLENILETIPTSGAGVNIAILEAARKGFTLETDRPSKQEQQALIDKTLEKGGIGIKLLGGHFPMDIDICESFIDLSTKSHSWVAWHVGNSQHGSNILGLEDAISCASGRFLHVAHVNSYCRSQISNELDEALRAINLLKNNKNIFSESYLSPLNGTRLTIERDKPTSKVTETCLKKLGFTPNYEGMKKALLCGAAKVLLDDGLIGKLVMGPEAVSYWEKEGTVTTGSFSVNPAISRFLLAVAKRDDGSFVVDSLSTDGGTYPRNVIVENGLLLVKFGALSLSEFAVKASLNGARALGLENKGHLGVGADADISVLDVEHECAHATIVGGQVIMLRGELLGSGTTIICDPRGETALRKRGIKCIVKGETDANTIEKRFIFD